MNGSPIDRFLGRADAVERYQVLVRAPAELVYDVAEKFDLPSIPAVRFIFWMRGKLLGSTEPPPSWPKGLLAETTAMGWGILSRRPGRELVMGAVTQPWLADVKFRPLPPEEFVTFDEPGFVRIVWTLETEPLGSDRTTLRTETRAAATDEDSRRRFLSYWRWARFGILPIRWFLLPAVRREAERRQGELVH
jgi:hypothetical protein